LVEKAVLPSKGMDLIASKGWKGWISTFFFFSFSFLLLRDHQNLAAKSFFFCSVFQKSLFTKLTFYVELLSIKIFIKILKI
jgi:hypothetical protein